MRGRSRGLSNKHCRIAYFLFDLIERKMARALILHLYNLSYFYIKYLEGENIHHLSVTFVFFLKNSHQLLGRFNIS